MPAKRNAGALRGLVHVQQQVEGDDQYGGVVIGWETKATVAAGFLALRGTETVMASRLAGEQPYVVTIRSSELTRTMTPAWRLVDARRAGRVFNIRAVSDPDGKGAWLECLCEETVT